MVLGRISLVAALLSLSGLGLCQDMFGRAESALSIYPECAQPCFISAIGGGLCSATDQDCMCTDKTFTANITACVTTASCTVLEQLNTMNVSATVCSYPVRNRSQNLVIASDTLSILTAVILIARFIFKIFVIKHFAFDDWMVLITALSAAPTASIMVYGSSASGLGQDMWALSTKQITQTLMYFYITTALYFTTASLIKLTFLAFYMRIFPGATTRRLLWGTFAVVIANGIAFVFAGVFQCTPIDAYWTKWTVPSERHCININAVAWANAAINIALDLWVLAIPMWELRRLQLHWKKKIGVGLMFSVGAFVTITSILRLQSLISFSENTNVTWSFYNVALWSTIEIGVGVFCANMPVLRLMFVWMFPNAAGSTARKTPLYYHKASDEGRSAASSHARGHLASVNRAEQKGGLDGHGGIMFQKSYEVQYTDNDEVGLVDMERNQRPGTASPSRSNPGTAM